VRLCAALRVFAISAVCILSILFTAIFAQAEEIKVFISGGFAAAYSDLLPEFERATGHTVITARGSSMGESETAIPKRLERGETADVLILVGDALDQLIEQGHALAGSRVDLARSLVGMSVRAGAPKPDISSVEALKQTLINAESIGYSASASGVYLWTELFPRLGIADDIRTKSHQILGEPVGAAIARGEVEIGFQQISELLPIPDIDFVGPIPDEVQLVTAYAAGIAANATNVDAAGKLIEFLASPKAHDAIRRYALEPID
jgi:molybdate transport system substrate-binding protein